MVLRVSAYKGGARRNKGQELYCLAMGPLMGVKFKKTSCRPVDFKKVSCPPIDFKEVLCRMVLPCRF